MIELLSAVDEKNPALEVFIKLKKAFDKWSYSPGPEAATVSPSLLPPPDSIGIEEFIAPVPKTPNPSHPCGFRPIALTSLVK